MRKITLLLFCLFTFSGFSQTPLEKINDYVNDNLSKIGVQQQDVADLVIVNDFSSESTGINNYHVKQRYSGIEIYNSDSNFWIKNGEVINGGEDFINNIARKINITVPKITVENGVIEALTQLGENLFAVQILESDTYEYKLSNGVLTEDPIRAKLVYFLTETNQLKLVWSYEFYSQNTKHLWNLKVDAVTGKIIDKQDLVLSCNFIPNQSKRDYTPLNEKLFSKRFFKEENQFVFNPGTTQYRVIPFNYESPNHSPRQLISNPEYVANASPKGWHDDSNSLTGTTASLKYSITRGNNVWARNDFAGTNSTTTPNGTSPTGTGAFPNLTFDFPYVGTSDVASSYVNAATTNLFYMNNIMHDLWYQYGFNEANKNFQVNNYGRGGSQADAVIAESQDGSQATDPNLNNANFSTPADGSSPRMQMYLWDVGPPFFFINSPADIAGGKVARDNSFDPGHVDLPQSPDNITADLALYSDGVHEDSDACEPPINGAAMVGKIVVIRRGDCTFISKVKFAQEAGAIAVIMVNNVIGTVGMAGSDGDVVIPAISVTQEVGEEIIAKMQTQTVNATLQKSTSFLNSDGDFDNGIISHEYGHGISTRLSGNCLGGSEEQGEGWSDWFWLMMQIKPGDTRNDARGIGTFTMNQPTNGTGIREFKYSTNMSVNPHTYADTNDMWYTNTSGVQAVDTHGVGSVWAVILWDLAWNYIDKYGYDSNIYTGTGGNNKVMRLVLDAIKLDGCNPTFITARDAILAADLATTGGANYCMIWRTFARRGVGVGASSGPSNSGAVGIQDQIQSFVEPTPGSTPATGSACTLGIDYFENNDMLRIYPNPTNGLLNIRINNYVGKVNFQVIDINGRIVSEFKNQDFNIEKALDLNNLQSGVYVIKIIGDNLNYTEKIIKK